MKTLILGAGGFIAGHLVDDLVSQGHEVVTVDIKPNDDWYSVNPDARNFNQLDLRKQNIADWVMRGSYDKVYNLACDMGGMNFIENHKYACMRSVLINTHLVDAAVSNGLVGRYFYSSSACVYAADKQTDTNVTALKEADAYPAMSEDGYGWEKLFSERYCRHAREDHGLATRIARFHNVYGPRTSYDDLRGKAPAMLSKKVIEAKLSGNQGIEIWGDGEQTRSFMYISDCVKGIQLITEGDYFDPINLGSHELVSINQLVDIIEEIAGVKLKRNYKLDAPLGVRGRNSDNTLIKKLFDWEPSTTLQEGIEKTYAWIFDKIRS